MGDFEVSGALFERTGCTVCSPEGTRCQVSFYKCDIYKTKWEFQAKLPPCLPTSLVPQFSALRFLGTLVRSWEQ